LRRVLLVPLHAPLGKFSSSSRPDSSTPEESTGYYAGANRLLDRRENIGCKFCEGSTRSESWQSLALLTNDQKMVSIDANVMAKRHYAIAIICTHCF
jgi:RNA polymerase subunit RPABC4/transcription elongation factor Spt4